MLYAYPPILAQGLLESAARRNLGRVVSSVRSGNRRLATICYDIRRTYATSCRNQQSISSFKRQLLCCSPVLQQNGSRFPGRKGNKICFSRMCSSWLEKRAYGRFVGYVSVVLGGVSFSQPTKACSLLTRRKMAKS